MADAKDGKPRGPDPQLLKLLSFWGQRANSKRFKDFFEEHAHKRAPALCSRDSDRENIVTDVLRP